jgi:hypothetical protein
VCVFVNCIWAKCLEICGSPLHKTGKFYSRTKLLKDIDMSNVEIMLLDYFS